MEKKLFITAVLVMTTFALCACNTNAKEEDDITGETNISITESDTEKSTGNIIEDEIFLDYAEKDTGSDEIDYDSTDTAVDNSSTSSQNSIKDDSSVSSESCDEKDNSESTEVRDTMTEEGSYSDEKQPENPYDKDGDGFLDGWY